jgi:hypothetical protein
LCFSDFVLAGGIVMKNLVVCLAALMVMTLCIPAQGQVIITPSNDVVDGNLFSFDLIVSEPDGASGLAFQTTISFDGPGLLLLEETLSQEVDSDPAYWIFGNSLDAGAVGIGGNSFQFGDSTNDGEPEALVAGDIVARYVFAWDVEAGAGLYNFTIDLDPRKSYVQGESLVKEALLFSPGPYEGGSSGFMVYIPEPATLTLLALGGAMLLKKRRS